MPSLSGRIICLTGIDRAMVNFTKMTAKLFAFSPYFGLLLGPLIIAGVMIEGMIGLPWPLASGLVVGGIWWWKTRRQQA